MATRQFADLSSYRRALDNAQGTTDLLNTILGGVQQGIQLQRLPQTIQENAIAQQLQNAINLEKLQAIQNPQQAIANQIEKELTLKAALNPDLGLLTAQRGLGTIATPGAITAAQMGALPVNVPTNFVSPTAAAGLPITEVAPFGIGTGVYSDPSVPLAAAQRKSDNELNQLLGELQAKSQFDVDTAIAKATALEPIEQRKFQREADLKRGLADTEFTNKMTALQVEQENALARGDRDAANKLTNEMAVLREKNATATTGQTPYQLESQQRVLLSIDDLIKSTDNTTVGFSSLTNFLPNSPARYYASKLDTLKSSITFNELSQMRADSKTGGALGAISDRETKLLESSLAALDQGLSPTQMKTELGKAKAAIERWQKARSNPSGSQGSSTPPVRVNTKAERDALKPGTRYVTPSGAISTR